MRYPLMILLCAMGMSACEAARDTDILWVKYNYAAQERCQDGHFAKALRELALAVEDRQAGDARLAVGLLHLGFLQRCLHNDVVADSLIERALNLGEDVLWVEPAWRKPPARWIRGLIPGQRHDVVEALGVSEASYSLWQSFLGADHPDIIVLHGLMAGMEQNQGHYAVSDSMFSHCIPSLARAGPTYSRYGEAFTRLWIRPHD